MEGCQGLGHSSFCRQAVPADNCAKNKEKRELEAISSAIYIYMRHGVEVDGPVLGDFLAGLVC